MKCTDCNAPVRPVVAVDIDGTMAQYHKHLLNFMRDYFGSEFPDGWDGTGNWEDYLGLSHSAYTEAKLAFRQGGFKRWMPPFPDAGIVCRTAKTLDAEVWITTTRPYLRLDSVDPDTREWLKRNGIQYDSLLYDENKYARLRQHVGIGRIVAILDDLPEQYEAAVRDLVADIPILIERPHNLAYREKSRGRINTARSLHEASILIAERIGKWRLEFEDA